MVTFARPAVGAADADRQLVAVNADALVRLTRAVLPAISPRTRSRLPVERLATSTVIAARRGAQSAIVKGLTHRRSVRSILLSRNSFTKSFDG